MLLVFLAGVVLVAAWLGWQALAPGAMLRVEAPAAVAIPGRDGQYRVTVRLINDGPAVVITDVHSSRGAAAIYAPESDGRLVIPAGMTAELAEDGAHVVVTLEADPPAALPVTLSFASGKSLTFRATVGTVSSSGMAMEMGLFGFGHVVNVGADDPAPTLSLSARQDGQDWLIDVLTSEFVFENVPMGTPHVPGTGHAHLYLNGLKLGRLYVPSARIGALPPGDHMVRVTLNANDHRAYVVDGDPVTAIAPLSVR